MFDDDSVGDDKGALTSADGVVRELRCNRRQDAGRKRGAASRAQARQHRLRFAGLRIEISVGPGQGRSWTIGEIDAGDDADTRWITLTNPEGGGATPVDPTDRSEFRIAGGDTHGRIVGFGMGPNILFNGRPQPGGISYGDIEVVQVSLGRGNDEVRVDYATNAEDHVSRLGSEADYNTQTLLDTGVGDDVVTIRLEDGEDGAFALNLKEGDDSADASASTLEIVVFGWDGADEITGGSGDDILFGDRGRIDYVNTVLTDTDRNDATRQSGDRPDRHASWPLGRAESGQSAGHQRHADDADRFYGQFRDELRRLGRLERPGDLVGGPRAVPYHRVQHGHDYHH